MSTFANTASASVIWGVRPSYCQAAKVLVVAPMVGTIFSPSSRLP
ncbi:hypothetical protein [Streptomyces sp. SHP 1-2]|nr:hypothetical protein [Streptomyces sp. SHP 1-2]